ncbi:DUF6776 family protein [Arenimonas oryziterrae]|uniref:Uncharacterized protein n=1 Tax=Arenimonas oryziterrae DSM 21050 = YC6267 TaxID=1121015 RepID=A0A091ASS9_9GAMM|nr:DUF6776 family protein [Arenimonas oryziterrae]KFN42411.1 hypothetical protein N789_13725 [Arenimonas oryziterrae DSM 21050 = YC6267]
MSSPGPDPARFVIVPHRPYQRGWWWLVAVLWPLTVAGTWYFASSRAAPSLSAARSALGSSSDQLEDAHTELRQLRQQVATLRRSDQISRNANIELQSTLSEREEEVSGLRADVDFYERLVGSTGQRHGLSVHEAVFAPEAGGTWHYTVTLTQNINRGAISKGQMRLSVEGVRGGKLGSVKWDDLLQKPASPGQPFSFRYFQQLEGSVMLPPGFTPQRVRVQLNADGNTVDQAFAWSDKKTGE